MIDANVEGAARPSSDDTPSDTLSRDAAKRQTRSSRKEDSAATIRRMSITLSDKGYQRLEELKLKTDAVSAVDVIRNALRVYEFLVRAEDDGRIVAVINEDNPAENTRLQLW
jgi:hypothetical protein